MSRFLVVLLLLISSQAQAWKAYDTLTGHFIEIKSKDLHKLYKNYQASKKRQLLTRNGSRKCEIGAVAFFDFSKGNFRYGDVDKLIIKKAKNNRKFIDKIHLYDNVSGKYRVFKRFVEKPKGEKSS